MPPSPENPYPISDQNIRFSIPYFRPDSQDVYPISDPVRCGNFSNSQWIYGVRDVVTKRCLRFFSSRSMSTATHVTVKMVSQTKQTDYTPYFRPKWQNLYPISDQKCLKMVPFGAAHTYMAYIWEYPPPPFPPGRKDTIFHTLFQTLWDVVVSATLNRAHSVRDVMAPQTTCVFVSTAR